MSGKKYGKRVTIKGRIVEPHYSGGSGNKDLFYERPFGVPLLDTIYNVAKRTVQWSKAVYQVYQWEQEAKAHKNQQKK